MTKSAWSFVHYACGHQTPVRGGDRHIATPCPSCTQLPPMTAQDVRLWRIRQGLTQQELANLLGVQVLAVARWEAGTRRPPAYLRLALERIVQKLGPRWLDPQPEGEPEPRPLVDWAGEPKPANVPHGHKDLVIRVLSDSPD
jgi:DNA-binding transcriptional regulator YiaG